MTVHIIFRSGGMIVNMVLGCLLVKKRSVFITTLRYNLTWLPLFRYTPKQVASVLVVTVGIVLTTLSASKPKVATSGAHSVAVSLYAQGIAILSLALLLSGFLGIVQDWVFTWYIKPTEAQTASDPRALPSWQENMFYLHSLALPLFYFSKESIITELSRMGAGPPISLSSIPLGAQAYIPSCISTVPSIFLHLFANTVTQLICVIGVNRLTGRVSSLTVTLILSVRKAVSLLLSVAVYGGQTNAKMWTGAALVFLGTVGYSTRSQPKRVAPIKDKED